ncbi:MAG: hypothetical protein ACQEVA_22215 [Myxococcota bacterium]
MLLVLTAIGMAFLTVYAVYKYVDSTEVDFDVNEGIEPAIDGPIEMHALRRDPSKLDALRGKVNLISYNSDVNTTDAGTVAESWLVDSNGATITIETTFEGPGAPHIARTRRGSVDVLHSPQNDQNIARRNVRIEENARWLADMLDVPFED